jgi:hypothetical protein
MGKATKPQTMLSRPSRLRTFRDREIRLVGVDGETWVCASDVEVALGHSMGLPNWAMEQGECVMASITGIGGVTLRLCVSFPVVMGMSARSQTPGDDVADLWAWLKANDGPWSAHDETDEEIDDAARLAAASLIARMQEKKSQ